MRLMGAPMKGWAYLRAAVVSERDAAGRSGEAELRGTQRRRHYRRAQRREQQAGPVDDGCGAPVADARGQPQLDL